MKQVMAFTDGSVQGNPGPAGWAALVDGVLYSDSVGHATNNEAEMLAIMYAVMYAPSRCRLFIHTDSKLAIGWLSKSFGMRNKDLIRIAKAYFVIIKAKGIVVTFKHVKGHSGDPGNTRVDRAAKARSGIAWIENKRRTDVHA